MRLFKSSFRRASSVLSHFVDFMRRCASSYMYDVEPAESFSCVFCSRSQLDRNKTVNLALSNVLRKLDLNLNLNLMSTVEKLAPVSFYR